LRKGKVRKPANERQPSTTDGSTASRRKAFSDKPTATKNPGEPGFLQNLEA
jgi:hypothetical protein